jgi:hypothetical protein
MKQRSHRKLIKLPLNQFLLSVVAFSYLLYLFTLQGMRRLKTPYRKIFTLYACNFQYNAKLLYNNIDGKPGPPQFICLAILVITERLGLTLQQSITVYFVSVCFVCFSLHTAIIPLKAVNQLILVTVKCCVFFAVRTKFLYIIYTSLGSRRLQMLLQILKHYIFEKIILENTDQFTTADIEDFPDWLTDLTLWYKNFKK